MKKTDQFEVSFFEQLVQRRPNYVEALSALAEVYTACSLYEKGLEIAQRLAVLCPEDSLVFYNLACSYALLSRHDLALKALEQALGLGYTDWKYMRHDPDFKTLSHDPRFKALLAAMQEKKAQSKRRKK